MHNENSLQRLGSTMEQLGRHWESRHQAVSARKDLSPRTPGAFTVALSREAGTLGTLVAREVGKRMGWQVYDHELLERIAEDMHVRATLLAHVDERQQSWLLESVEALLATPVQNEWNPRVTESAYVRHLIQTVLALGFQGECVIVGRGSPFILPAETTLRVRLVAPLNHRMAALSKSLGISTKEAARRIRTLDRERSDFVQDHFQKDPTDPRHYDLVLNTGRLSTDAAAGLIDEALRHVTADTLVA
jgi:cytidylate kinase